MKFRMLMSRNLQCFGLALCLGCGFAVPVAVGFSQDQPPQVSSTPAPTRPPDLVELIMLDPTLRLDVRYATANNLVGRERSRAQAVFLASAEEQRLHAKPRLAT